MVLRHALRLDRNKTTFSPHARYAAHKKNTTQKRDPKGPLFLFNNLVVQYHPSFLRDFF